MFWKHRAENSNFDDIRSFRPSNRLGRFSALATILLITSLAPNSAKSDLLVAQEDKRPAISPPGPTEEKVGCDPGRFKIAVDAGHTAQAPGATSSRGVKEYLLNENLAKRIIEALKHAGYVSAYVITATGVGNEQLRQRVEQANSLRINLLISIHHDDVQPKYYQSWIYNGKRYSFSDKYSGYSIFVSHQNNRFDDSLLFGKLLGEGLQAREMHFSFYHAEDIRGERRPIVDAARGIYRYDGLFVLRNTRAPAVLLEAGVIVNRNEELVAASTERQEAIASAIIIAVNKFCTFVQNRTRTKHQ